MAGVEDFISFATMVPDAIPIAEINDGQTLSPLPTTLKKGLIPVTVFGFLSFFSSVVLFILLTRQFVIWRRKPSPVFNQFVFLIYNLVFADIQQSIAFLLNVQWLHSNQITVRTPTCWAQGWFVSTGDMASGAFCFAIGCHTFASVILNYRLRNLTFFLLIGTIWACVYASAIVGIAMHPNDIYVRAGAWCWVNIKYEHLRLWAHYLYIFTFEVGTVFVYSAMYIILVHRIRKGQYETGPAVQARQAASLMVVYPIVYVVCTFPLALIRTLSMAHKHIDYWAFCLAGAMITSNGWLDVLLYTCTRRILAFNDHDRMADGYGIDTFRSLWGDGNHARMGTTTLIEATGTRAYQSAPSLSGKRSSGGASLNGLGGRRGHARKFSSRASNNSTHESLNELIYIPAAGLHVKKETTVCVRSDPMQESDAMALEELTLKADQRSSSGKGRESYEFETKPPGWDS